MKQLINKEILERKGLLIKQYLQSKGLDVSVFEKEFLNKMPCASIGALINNVPEEQLILFAWSDNTDQYTRWFLFGIIPDMGIVKEHYKELQSHFSKEQLLLYIELKHKEIKKTLVMAQYFEYIPKLDVITNELTNYCSILYTCKQ